MSEDVEEITDKLLKILAQDLVFRREWERRTATHLREEYTRVPDKTDEVTSTFEELIRVVDLATQSFLDVESSIYKITDEAVNPDASAIFAVDLQLERVDSQTTIQRLLAATRRVNQLGRKFPVRLAHGCHVTNLLKFSTSLCEMLFRIEGHLRNLKGDVDVAVNLSKCASDFNRIVVETLEKWKRDCEKAKVRPAERPTTPRAKTPQRRPLSLLQGRSPGGFLMSPELVKARQRLQKRSRSATPSKQRTSPACRPPTDPSILRKRQQMANEMENKYGQLLGLDTVLRRSLPRGEQRDSDEESATLRVAKRISAQVIRDLRKSLGGPPLILPGQR